MNDRSRVIIRTSVIGILTNLLLAGFLGWSLFDSHLIPHQFVYLAAGLLILIPLLLFLLQIEKQMVCSF